MISLHLQTISPYLKDKTRLLALSCGNDFGSIATSEDRIFDHMDNFVSKLSSEVGFNHHRNVHQVLYPTFSEGSLHNNAIAPSDVLLKDTFRQHRTINDTYRKGIPDMYDIKKIYDPSTKLYHSISRGYERHLIETMGLLDSEILNRRILKPLLI